LFSRSDLSSFRLKHFNGLRYRLLQYSWIVDVVDAILDAKTQHHSHNLWGTFLINCLHLLEQNVTDILILSAFSTNLLNLFQSQNISLGGWLYDLSCWHLRKVGGLLSSSLIIHVWECLL
jgi:hypothetical protein